MKRFRHTTYHVFLLRNNAFQAFISLLIPVVTNSPIWRDSFYGRSATIEKFFSFFTPIPKAFQTLSRLNTCLLLSSNYNYLRHTRYNKITVFANQIENGTIKINDDTRSLTIIGGQLQPIFTMAGFTIDTIYSILGISPL